MQLMTLKRPRSLALALVATLFLSGCGTVLYPERKGQVSGRIDPAVAALNGVGLLFFFVPGVIAFAVDFNNGTIYLPPGQTAALDSADEGMTISFEGRPDREELEQLLRLEAGVEVELEQAMMLSSEQYLAMTQNGDIERVVL